MANYKDIEPINKKALAIITTDDLYGRGMQAGIELVLEIINTQPTVNDEEARHGEWILIVERSDYLEPPSCDTAKCSVCGRKIDVSETGFKYCPHCGAKMDGGN